MTSRFLSLLLAGTVFGLAAPVLAGEPELLLSGDGSATNNSDLLRGAYECSFDCPIGTTPGEDFEPPFDIDWSVALRGSYIWENAVSRFETAIVPSLTMSHEGLRSTFDLDAEAEIVKPSDSPGRLAALRFASAYEYGLDEVTNFATEGDLSITQAGPGDPSDPPNTAISPVTVVGDLAATVTRDVGVAYLGLRGTVGRSFYGQSTLFDNTVVDNTFSNNTRYGAGIRVSRQLTPIVTAFADGSVERRAYDAASPALLVFLDSTDWVGKVGLNAELGTTVEFEGAVGVGLRKFADATLADVQATLYEASLTFRPNETLEIISGFSSAIEGPGPDGLGTASIEREASIEGRYKVNSWLALRAAAGWSSSSAVGVVDEETEYSIAFGSEYLLNQHVSLTADYEFTRTEATGTATVDAHIATLGVKVSR